MKNKNCKYSINVWMQLVFVVICCKVNLWAQDVHFSQFHDLETSINPSMAGAYKGDVRAMVGHKQQWRGVANGYVTSFASIDMPLGKRIKGMKRMALGGGFFADKAGTAGFGTTKFFLNYAYPIQINERNFLSAGIEIVYVQLGLNASKLKWDDQYVDGSYNPGNRTNEILNDQLSRTYFDEGFGFLWRKFNAQMSWVFGASAFHLIEPDNSLGRGSAPVPRKYLVHGEAELPRKNYSLMPKLMVVRQGDFMEIVGGSMVKFQIGSQSLYTNARTASAILGGVFYRYNDAVIAVVQYSFNQMLMAGFSYDVNVSKFRAASNLRGGFEVTLKYLGAFDNNRKKL